MDFGVGAYLLPAALVFGAPASPGTYEKGLFCESVELVERVAGLGRARRQSAARRRRHQRAAAHTACIYATKADVRARTVRFEKNLAANHTTYSLYQVQVTAHGMRKPRSAISSGRSRRR